eukprot:62403-Pleurochrysis_carterae.AAC.3
METHEHVKARQKTAHRRRTEKLSLVSPTERSGSLHAGSKISAIRSLSAASANGVTRELEIAASFSSIGGDGVAAWPVDAKRRYGQARRASTEGRRACERERASEVGLAAREGRQKEGDREGGNEGSRKRE